tara:strand:- start:7136 stop:7411 length:276 start_codon:yes stop_codon:yes gene_type:complete
MNEINDTDSKVYISLLHKCINDSLGQISEINIEKLKGNQEEFRKIVSWIYFDNYELFTKNVQAVLGNNENKMSEELADLVKDLTNSADVEA